ncbi:hypothetical protein EYF80_037870 [Liparis tanakae]|uniref:Uncharacterized protein n=1 Tax=Liparis tanakae TaxID=230148 RepID=A0A4Z2GGE4_9TELE|nr:hypothetical protein EYF80_037870 [Liparis tanakae]
MGHRVLRRSGHMQITASQAVALAIATLYCHGKSPQKKSQIGRSSQMTLKNCYIPLTPVRFSSTSLVEMEKLVPSHHPSPKDPKPAVPQVTKKPTVERGPTPAPSKKNLPEHQAKHARPMSSYSEDVPLLKRLGVNVGGAYHSREGGTRIMQSIAHTISGELRAKLQSVEFWGLLFDIAKTEQEIVYIVSVSNNGEFASDFLGLIELGADRTAQAITDGLVRHFQGTGLDDWTTKLVALCTDGAAVNVGMYNGVVPKLRQLATVGDSLVHILFTAYTLENCAKSADRNVPYCETFNCSVGKLLQFYLQKGGAKRTSALKQLCEENGISFVKLALMHIHLSKQTTETFDPKQAIDLWMKTAYRRINQRQGGVSSSSTMQEAEAEDSGGDSEEDSCWFQNYLELKTMTYTPNARLFSTAFLCEDVSGFFRTCTDESDEPELDGVAVGLLTVTSENDTRAVQ